MGLLEVVPHQMNQRPDEFVGRNDMETMLASKKAEDWIKLSCMLLGPVPDGFRFVPKHQARSYQ